MRILVYKNGGAIVDFGDLSHSARINGVEPDSILPITDDNVKKHIGKTFKELQDERKAFHILQQKGKKG